MSSKKYLKELIQSFPNSPGVYRMYNAKKEILYIGKAKDLKKRLQSYFSNKTLDIKTKTLLKHICDIDIILTETEKEAFILENQSIKHYQPRYNIQLKDDKSYPYIKITREPFPRIYVTRFKKADGAQYFGPYPALGSSRKLLQTLRDIFPIRDCKQAISLTKLEPKCINVDINKCLGPCIYKHLKQDYDLVIKNLTLFLNGKNKQLIKNLQQDMKTKSLALDFESAARLRDQIERLSHLSLHQQVCLGESISLHIIVSAQLEDARYFMYQEIKEGKLLVQKGFYSLDVKEAPFELMLLDALSEWFGNSHNIPKKILCNSAFKQDYSLQSISDITCILPKIGTKAELIKRAELNARSALQRLYKHQCKLTAVEDLAQELKLKHIPKIMIGFDISHYYGTNIVGSAVCFKDGKAQKDWYRHFNIKSITNKKSNDPKAMYETVLRRLNLCKKEGFLPDTLVIDGGTTQLHAAYQAHQDSDLANSPIQVIGLAKREEEIYLLSQKKPLKLKRQSPGLKLCQAIRDEAHRFAGRLQKNRRHKEFMGKSL